MKLLVILLALQLGFFTSAQAIEKKSGKKPVQLNNDSATEKTTQKTSEKKVQVNESQNYKYGEVVKFQEGQTLQFPDFKVVYLNEEDPAAKSEIKSTADVHIRHFILTDKNGEQKFDIVHGQLPPADKKLKLISGNYIIHTFKSPKGESLFPHSLVIVKK